MGDDRGSYEAALAEARALERETAANMLAHASVIADGLTAALPDGVVVEFDSSPILEIGERRSTMVEEKEQTTIDPAVTTTTVPGGGEQEPFETPGTPGAAPATDGDDGGEQDEKPSSKTTYVLLESRDDGLSWVPIGTEMASNRERALAHRFANAEIPRAEGTKPPILWQAVPSRSWKALKEFVPDPTPPPRTFIDA